MTAGRWLCASLLALAGASATACGAGRRADASAQQEAATRTAPLVLDADEDYDNLHSTHYDLDDNPIRFFGSTASAAETAAIEQLVRSYYADAAAGQGGRACALIYSILAEALPTEYPGYGGDCAAVATHLFKLKHVAYAQRVATLQFTGARVEGDQGFALLKFKGLPGMYDEHLRLHREAGRWTLHQLLDEGLP